MSVLVKVIDFRKNNLNEYEARVGGIAITASFRGNNDWGIDIDEYETITVPPCHEEYFDSPACEAGKDLDKVEDFDACELTCPAMKKVETLNINTAIWGEPLEEMVREARCELQRVDQMNGEPEYNQTDANAFLESKWRIGGDLY